uniref:EF-hand domain-containing protein n=1 Tax=Percolomonas cosmopolitus TaxID=63605 RepID=A0A7S1KTY5_9EUKA
MSSSSRNHQSTTPPNNPTNSSPTNSSQRPTINQLFESLQLGAEAANAQKSNNSALISREERQTIEILRKLALGEKFYDSLNYEEEEEAENDEETSENGEENHQESMHGQKNRLQNQVVEQNQVSSNKSLLKRDIITSRKHQQHLQQVAQNEIEQQQLEALLRESQEQQTAGGLSLDEGAYYKSVRKIRDDIQEKLGEQIRFAGERLRNRLAEDEERVLESKTRQMMDYRMTFAESEKMREGVEREELQRRREWKRQLDPNHAVKKLGSPGSVGSESGTPAYTPPSARHQNDSTTPRRQQNTSSSTRRSMYSPLDVEQQRHKSSRSSRRGDVKLLMTVDIGDGRIDTIKIHANDTNYEKLARNFQQKHRLGEQVIVPLMEHIKLNVDALEREQQSGSSDADRRHSLGGGGSGRAPRSIGSLTPGKALKSEENRLSMRSRYNRSSVADVDPVQALIREKPQIDKKSRKIAKRVKDMDKPVYIRLFQQAVEQRKKREDSQLTQKEEKLKQETSAKLALSAQSKALTQSRTKGKFQNYGHKLYTEGIMQMIEKEKQSELQQKINQTKEELQHTFKPEISEYAKQLARTREDLLKRITEDPKRQHEVQKLHQLEEEEELFSFKPTINEKSAQLMQQKESRRKAIGAAHHELLFRDAERRRMKKQEYAERMIADTTFHPNLNSRKNETILLPREENVDAFIDRLTYSKQIQEEQMRREMQDDIDPSTGRKLFVPNVDRPIRAKRVWEEKTGAPNSSIGGTGRSSLSPGNRGASSSNIHLDLYLSRQQLDEEKDRIKQQREMELKKMAQTSHVKTKSKRIVESALSKRLRALFDSFDTEKTGIINIRTVDFHSLDDLLGEMLQEIFQSANDEGKVHFSFDEFLRLAKKYIKKTSIHGPKNAAISTWIRSKPPSHREQEAEKCTFKPQLSRKSMQLAENKRPGSAKKKRIEYLTKEKIFWMNRTQDLKDKIEEQRTQECTFHPNPKGRMKIDPEEVQMLTQRLTTQKLPTHNEILTTDEKRFRENCTFEPDLTKPRVKIQSEMLYPSQDDLNQSYVMLQHQRKLNSFLNSEFDLLQSRDFASTGSAAVGNSETTETENANPNVSSHYARTASSNIYMVRSSG